MGYGKVKVMSTPEHHMIDNEVNFIEVDFDRVLTKVWIYDKKYQVAATGYARLYDGDIYDRNLGFDIAYARAVSRVAPKVAKAAIKRVRQA
jgi:hypothetical protein